MPSYRFYLMNGEHIKSGQNLDCADDAEAIIKAEAVLEGHPETQSIEIWQGTRFVTRFPMIIS